MSLSSRGVSNFFAEHFKTRLMKKIVLPTDFSEVSLRAIAYAINLFGLEAEYYLLHAFHSTQAGASMLVSMNPILEKQANEELNTLETKLMAEHGEGLQLKSYAVAGYPSDSCNKLVQEINADCIVVGTIGASGIKEVIIGSNAASIIQHVHCPVIAVPEEAEIKKPERILYATDYSTVDPKVYNPLKSIVELGGAEMVIATVQSHVVPTGVAESPDHSDLDKMFSDVRRSYERIENENVVEGVEQFVEERSFDMLVAVEHKYSFIENLLHRSTSQRMAMHSKVPLLVLQDN